MTGVLVVVGGPTAAGKTALAVALAEATGAALVSADAMQVYRGMDIGTAKPGPLELRRHPHACIDVRDPDQAFDVADFLAEVDRIRAGGGPVIVVGGTIFWLSALLRPMAELPRADPALRAELETLPDLHQRLAAVDPESAARLHPNDRVRLVRALEVHALTGRPLSELHAQGPRRPPPVATVLWLDREDLRPRIDSRLEGMMAAGYLDEVRRLRARGYDQRHKPMRSLGYRHLGEHLDGVLDLDEAVRRTGRDTWRLARKQRTWGRGLEQEPLDPAEALERGLAALQG